MVIRPAGEVDVTAESEAPIGRNILELTNIQQSENYSCVAASTLGTIEANTFVRVQGTSLRHALQVIAKLGKLISSFVSDL